MNSGCTTPLWGLDYKVVTERGSQSTLKDLEEVASKSFKFAYFSCVRIRD